MSEEYIYQFIVDRARGDVNAAVTGDAVPNLSSQSPGRRAPERDLVLWPPRQQRYLRPPDRADQDESFLMAAEASRPDEPE